MNAVVQCATQARANRQFIAIMVYIFVQTALLAALIAHRSPRNA